MLSADAAARNFGKIWYFTRFQTVLRFSPADAAVRNIGKICYFTRFQTALRRSPPTRRRGNAVKSIILHDSKPRSRRSPADAAARNIGKICYFTRFQTALRCSPAELAVRHRAARTCPNYAGLVGKARRQKHDGAEHAELNGDGKDWVVRIDRRDARRASFAHRRTSKRLGDGTPAVPDDSSVGHDRQRLFQKPDMIANVVVALLFR